MCQRQGILSYTTVEPQTSQRNRLLCHITVRTGRVSPWSSIPPQLQKQNNENERDNIMTHRKRNDYIRTVTVQWAHTVHKNKSMKRLSHLDLSFSRWSNAELFPLFFWCFVSLKELKLVANFRCFHLYILNKITRSYNIWWRLAQKNCLEMSYKDDNSFDSVNTTENAVLRDTVHRLYQGILYF